MHKWQIEVPELTTHPVLAKIAAARKDSIVYPAQEKVYSALQLTDFDQVRVVILGQDPYQWSRAGTRSCLLGSRRL